MPGQGLQVQAGFTGAVTPDGTVTLADGGRNVISGTPGGRPVVNAAG